MTENEIWIPTADQFKMLKKNDLELIVIEVPQNVNFIAVNSILSKLQGSD